jgi:hypothetical protein
MTIVILNAVVVPAIAILGAKRNKKERSRSLALGLSVLFFALDRWR